MMNQKFQDKDFYNNGFDLIRYWAAISVMLGHFAWKAQAFSNTPIKAMDTMVSIMHFFPGVVLLFAISGFLVTASLERSKSKKEYMLKRVVRLYPELWVCTIVNLIMLCIVVPNLLDKSIIVWLGTQVFGVANTPSCLANFATGSVNGSLWTIFTEIQLYVVICFLNGFLKKMNNVQWGIALSVSAAVNVGCDYAAKYFGGAIAKMIERAFVPYFIWFLLGCFIYHKRDVLIPVLKKLTLPLLAVYTVLRLLKWNLPGYYAGIMVGILAPLIAIGGGNCLPAIRIKCDLTYGIFLYHWVVLNVIVHYDLINLWDWGWCLLLLVTVTFALAWLSWRFVGRASGKLIKRILNKMN